jgi:phosphatidylserine/phosphatidylglycerophosphate/cardiolipin synthase-like enzyme
MPVFLITHKALAQSLIRASKRGVAVKVILDATNAHGAYSAHKLLRQNGIQVKTENFAGKLHSKSVIIDDTYTIIGSMNFSRSGENKNDENMLIIKNREIAVFYRTFFQYLWKRIPDKWLKFNARAESPDSIGSCKDGIDNDFDGKIDKNDDSCLPFKKTLINVNSTNKK